MSNEIICNQARLAMGRPTTDVCPECFMGPCRCPRYEKPEPSQPVNTVLHGWWEEFGFRVEQTPAGNIIVIDALKEAASGCYMWLGKEAEAYG